jgi:hypothetical protein
MMTLKDVVPTQHALFLRDDLRSEFLYRLPPAPVVLLLPGAGPALHFTMYRYGTDDPTFTTMGGGLMVVALDFGTLPMEDAEAQTQLPSTAPPQISLPPVTAGKLHLWMGDQEVFSEPIPEASRPIVPLTLPLTVEAAVLMDAAAKQGLPLLYATAEGSLLVHYDGPPCQVRVDQSKALGFLSEKGVSFSSADIAATLIPDLIAQGIIRIDVTGDDETHESMLLASALAAGWLLEPEPGGVTWSAIPGIVPAPLSLKGKLRVRRELNGDHSAQVGGGPSTVQVPWFASWPMPPPPLNAISRVDLAETTVSRVQVSGMRSGPAEKYQDTRVEFEFPGGRSATATFLNWGEHGSERHTVRFLRTSQRDAYRFRLTARAGERSIVGDWQTSSLSMVVANFDALAAR